MGCTTAIIIAASVPCSAGLQVLRPFDDVALDAATSQLLDSFARLVNDSADVSNQSEFTQQLADAAVRVIYNVPPARKPSRLYGILLCHRVARTVLTQKVATQTEEAARRMDLPNPDDEGCTARDYSSMCRHD